MLTHIHRQPEKIANVIYANRMDNGDTDSVTGGHSVVAAFHRPQIQLHKICERSSKCRRRSSRLCTHKKRRT